MWPFRQSSLCRIKIRSRTVENTLSFSTLPIALGRERYGTKKAIFYGITTDEPTNEATLFAILSRNQISCSSTIKERPAVTIRRISLVPSRFEILKDELVVGHVAMKSPLLNKYRIDIDGIATCTFRMPLFTVYFHGRVNSETKIWVVMGPFKNQWSVLTDFTIDSVPRAAVLAFIHNQWYL